MTDWQAQLLLSYLAALAEIRDMAEHARRSIGQRTREDHLRRALRR